jgi:hypothetical protein
MGDHEVSIPPLSPCTGRFTGTLKLRLDFSPAGPRGGGEGGGCGGGGSHPPGILDQVKSWRILKPRQSLAVSYKRSELWVSEQAPGGYDFWGEYEPPQLTAEDIAALEHAGIDFLREPLTSVLHLNPPNCLGRGGERKRLLTSTIWNFHLCKRNLRLE